MPWRANGPHYGPEGHRAEGGAVPCYSRESRMRVAGISPAAFDRIIGIRDPRSLRYQAAEKPAWAAPARTCGSEPGATRRRCERIVKEEHSLARPQTLAARKGCGDARGFAAAW